MNNQVMIPKDQLPDCEVGETLTITGEDGDNFIVEPEYETEEKPADAPAPDAKMKDHAPAVAIVISGGRGAAKKK